MSKKQAAWLRVLVLVAIIAIYILATIKLYNTYGDLIIGMIFAAWLFFPALPVIGWLIVGVMLYVLIKVAITSLIKTYDTYNVFDM
ncbi:hypothetical protein [Pseudolactococcus reticulitermitis]|uniref:Uncharacterized protein n=1 Tax=Pseudolactococcus reticulitermitis TaxID=2025039 RepID=A0A224XA14_9LACT|nr:hypothetical protein [Lactococcus reticulitermitis]GAX46533.1 hypothetical protein RsY01_112 [Lactococcus reticulitermitis]